MPAHIIPNSLEGEKAPDIPLKEDGEVYEYLMYFEGDRYIAYSDDLEDLIALVITGYDKMDEDEKLDARLRYVRSTQKMMQVYIVANLTTEEREALEGWEMEALGGTYNKERSYQVRDFWRETLPEGVDPDTVPEDERLDVWVAPHPLVLIKGTYAPAPGTDVQPPLASPEGDNIIWLDPLSEKGFLESISATGAVTFGQAR